jgi:hypothetical protein
MPTPQLCWPDDDLWHRGKTKIELPAERHLRAFWKAEILDVDSENPLDKIIERQDPFVVRLRVQLEGRLWRCICGNWCFNLGFTPFGKGERFDLSDHLPIPEELHYNDWKGCESLCIERCVTVPGGSIPVGRCGTVYDCAAWFELRCCGDCEDADSHLAASGFEPLGAYQFV